MRSMNAKKIISILRSWYVYLHETGHLLSIINIAFPRTPLMKDIFELGIQSNQVILRSTSLMT